jgi:hypothetical protein
MPALPVVREEVGNVGKEFMKLVLLLVFGAATFAGAPNFALAQIQPVQPGPPAGPPAAIPGVSRTVTLPAGTEIPIRTIDGINSKTADEYKEYAASLDAPVLVNGVTVLPAQARAFFRATDIVKPGITRRASLSLSLVAVMVSGQRVSVDTSKLPRGEQSESERA